MTLIISTAAGFDKKAAHNPRTSGVIAERTYGSFTLHAREGNPEPTYWFDPERNMSINSVGLRNQSLGAFLRDDLPMIAQFTEDHGTRIRISLAPTGAGELRQMLALIQALPAKLGRCISEIEINAACPNHRKGDDLQPVLAYNPSEVRHLLEETGEHDMEIARTLKIAPKTSDETLADIVDLCVEFDIDGIVSGNTLMQSSTIGDIKRLSQDTGGMAGAPLFEHAFDQFRRLRKIVREKHAPVELIACGGVMKPSAANEYMKVGARRLQLGTYYQQFGIHGLQTMQLALP